MSLMKSYWMLQNSKVTAFTVSELLRENQKSFRIEVHLTIVSTIEEKLIGQSKKNQVKLDKSKKLWDLRFRNFWML